MLERHKDSSSPKYVHAKPTPQLVSEAPHALEDSCENVVYSEGQLQELNQSGVVYHKAVVVPEVVQLEIHP